MEYAEIIIDIEDGLITDVRGVPQGVVVIMRNYSTDGYSEEELDQDEYGVNCFVTYEWGEGVDRHRGPKVR